MFKSSCLSWAVCSFAIGCSGGGPGTAADVTSVGSEHGAAVVDNPSVRASNVVEECAGYNGFTAALATATVECLGTIDQRSFVLDANGFLARNFSDCAADVERLE